MRVASINGKRYILVIIDDYLRFTRARFLRTKDDTPDVIIKFLKKAQVNLQATVRYLRTDNGTLFINQTLRSYTEDVGFTHQTSVARTPQQNSVVERRNQTLVEAARTMLNFSKSPLFLWAEVVATTKPDLKFLHVFGALCYPTDDDKDLGKLKPTTNIGPELQQLTSGQISSRLVPTNAPSTSSNPPSKPSPSAVSQTIYATTLSQDTVGETSSTTIDQDAPSPSTTLNTKAITTLIQDTNVEEPNH
ncbi:retrovirus-related pol polyprotein from transposon TNT 1-94, partial [Tanacetum coccineum]